MINQERLVNTFLELVAINSPSGEEETICRDLVARFTALGGEIETDEHWNLIARFPGVGEWLMLSAHMDTVGTDRDIKPRVQEGVIYSDGTTILGADDKSGVAVILELIRSLQEEGASHPPIEVMISAGEEQGLRGARLLDKGRLRARRGYVLDAGGPINTLVTSAPSQDSMEVWVHGRTAHAGAEPEKGISAILVASEAIAAMPQGRIDAETTANVGIIQGGVATNIVPDKVYVKMEARSRDDMKLAEQTAAMAAAFHEAAERHGARIEFKLKRMYTTYRLADDHPVVASAVAVMRRLGLDPTIKASGGGTDANIYAEWGIHCAILSTGMAEVHTPKEHIAIQDMLDCAGLLREIVISA